MKLALNGATTMRADLLTDIKAAQAAGFDCLEIWASKLRDFLRHNSAEDLKQHFLGHNIQPLSINSQDISLNNRCSNCRAMRSGVTFKKTARLSMLS